MGRQSSYSKELRIKIVHRYLNDGESILVLAMEIGVNRNTIYKWVRQYQKYGDTAFKITHSNHSYTKEFKQEVAQAYLDGEQSYIELASKYNIPSFSTIESWVKRYNSHIELNNYIPGGKDIYMAKSREVNSNERLEIVKYCLDHELNYKMTAQIYETSYANVFNWVKKYRENGENGLSDKRGHHKSDTDIDETERLKRKIKKMEHELEMSQLEVKLLKKVKEIERRRSIEPVDTKSNTKQLKRQVKKK
ncbi:MAG: helix-turn-helix domain-containing protein [Thomasclavelia sp.]|jgi:transposase|nr:helix-turn-helix domain-containing protein [Thomasclavelia sp.]